MHFSLLFLAIVAGIPFSHATFLSRKSTTDHRAFPPLYTRQSDSPREIHYFDQPVYHMLSKLSDIPLTTSDRSFPAQVSLRASRQWNLQAPLLH
jgi:hypothetical protein